MKKKGLILCLIAAAAFSMAACGDSSDGTSTSVSGEESSESGETAENAETETEDDTEITFESQTIIDNDACSITITGIDEGGLLSDLTLSAELENKSSDVTYMFAIESAYINGVDADPYWADTVAAGKSAIETIEFDMSTLSEYGIEAATDIEMTFHVYNDDDWEEEYVVDETVHIYPYGEENATVFERESQDTDTVLIDNDSVTAILTGYEIDDTWGEYCLNVYLVNKTDTEVMFSVDDSSVNGYMADPYWASSVKAGKSQFTTIAYYESTLEEIGITDMETEVETIEFTLTVNDADSWDELTSELITLNP